MEFEASEQNSWRWYSYIQYIKLKAGTHVAAFTEAKLNTGLRKNYLVPEARKGGAQDPAKTRRLSMFTRRNPCRISATEAKTVRRMVYLQRVAGFSPGTCPAGNENSHDIAVSSMTFLTARTVKRPCRPRISTSWLSYGAEVDAGAVQQFLRDDQFGGEFLGQRLQAAGDVHRVADRRQMRGARIAHLADDGRAGMQADADAQGLVDVARHGLVEIVERGGHAPRRVERLAAGDLAARC